MNTSLSRTLKAGYAGNAYPTFFVQESTGLPRGGNVDALREIQKALGLESLEMVEFGAQWDESDQLFGGAVERGEVLTCGDGCFMIAKDIARYGYSFPLYLNQLHLCEPMQPDFTGGNAFIVFSYYVVALIVAAMLVRRLVDWLIQTYGVITGGGRWGEAFRAFHAVDLAAYSLAFFFIMQLHGGGYTGNTLGLGMPRLYEVVDRLLKTGSITLVVSPAYRDFKEDELFALTGGQPVEIIDSPLIAFDNLCRRNDIVTFGYDSFVFAYEYLRRGGAACRFQFVTLSQHATTPVPWVTESMHSGQQVMFVLPKFLPRFVREKLNGIILRIYSYENLWRANSRYALPSLYNMPTTSVDYAPVSIKVLLIPLIIIGVLYICCILCFAAELLWHRFGPRRVIVV